MPIEGTLELSGGSRYEGRATVSVPRWILPDPATISRNSERGHLGKQALTQQSTVATASVLGQLQQQPRQGWKTLSFLA